MYAEYIESRTTGEKLDVNKCIRMAIVHDIAEGVVGDLVVEGE